jgi:hypothetical protein
MKGGVDMTEKELRKVLARALTTLGYGQSRPGDIPAKTVAAVQLAIEQGEIGLPLSGEIDSKVQTALLSGAIGLLALSSASTESERMSAAFQIRKAAAIAATV